MLVKVTAPVGDKQITIETGKIAKQADGSVIVQMGDTIVLVAAVAATKAREGFDFFPLTVDYRERAAAAGRFPGGYFKREGRPTEKEILTSPLTDRPIRPLSPKGSYREVQVQTILPQARPAVTASLAAYRVGRVNLMTLLDNQTTVNRYAQELAALEAAEGTTLAELEMLLGRELFDSNTGRPAPGGDR